TDLAAAACAADRFREAVAANATRDLPLDVRFGIAERAAEDASPEAMFRRAELDLEATANEPTGSDPAADEPDARVSYHAVTSLVSALAYRDLSTAEHSRRVANLCVAVGRGLMSETACYLLEVGALLHDVGKLGVPDAVLRKPGPLNEAEWEVMGAHDRLGVEIIAAAFGSPELIAIVRTHHAWFGGNPRDPELPLGAEIPLAARILAVADSYDAMVSDRVYRKGRRRDDAFNELRRCAGAQFDPEVVERFIVVMNERHEAASQRQGRPALSKRGAFKIGLQIERLAVALDTRDLETLGVMAARLKATAEQIGVPAIADVAAALSESLERPGQWYRTLELT
ncbi:MAG: HD domain-containing protein, partial [Thermoleophilia bacterium]|nr:HD domain-containing protein [Thermoleophilia bacterium]